jgi:hypothetical protein
MVAAVALDTVTTPMAQVVRVALAEVAVAAIAVIKAVQWVVLAVLAVEAEAHIVAITAHIVLAGLVEMVVEAEALSMGQAMEISHIAVQVVMVPWFFITQKDIKNEIRMG